MKKIIFLFTVIIFFVPYYFVFANLQINEIMYDLKTGSDNGREWIEIYNDGDISVDLSSYRFFEADTNHKIKLVQGDTNIGPKGYAVIVSDPIKFKTDWPNNTFTIFDSSFSLNNDGEILMLKDKNLNIVDQYTYKSSSGGAGDGNSLQKINGQWQGATPTPGQENRISFVAPPVAKTTIVNQNSRASVKTSSEPKKIIQKEKPTQFQEIIPVENLEAFALQSGDTQHKENTLYMPMFISIFVIVSGAIGVYFIKQKRVVSKVGDDFTILDE